MPDFKWNPIVPLTEADRAIDLATLRQLYEAWWASKQQLEELSRDQFEEFNRRWVRRLCIETGILERLYDLDRATTKALIEHGFDEDLISHGSTNIAPRTLVAILRDQEAAIQLVLNCVANKRRFRKETLHELHSILTRHQRTTIAVDQFGSHNEIPLLRGEFKEHPNNLRRPDGSIHEFCPPIYVDSEVDRLLELYGSYQDDDPILVAAWLHHRFTQIHPYEDGNGRTAHAITALVLLRHNLLPFVMDRDLRSEYLDALEKGDAGDLSRLVEIFSRLEKNAILQALSLDVDADVSHQDSLVAAVLSSLTGKFTRRKAVRDTQLLDVNNVALALREQARVTVAQRLSELRATLMAIGTPQEPIVENGGADTGNSHWYKPQVIKTVRDAGKSANFSQNHYFIKGAIHLQEERMVFVVSFHHLGYELTGVMEATAFARLESRDESEDRESFAENFRPCSVEPFVFTYKTNAGDVEDSFQRWLDAALAIAFKEFGERL
jgi:prophage maintenance system killer protein